MNLSVQKQKRQQEILSTIRMLQFATQRHLMCVHDMGGIRNAHRILKEMRHYTNVTYYKKEYVYYLNKDGRALFGDKQRATPVNKLAHCMLRNEAWLHCHCPDDWTIEPELRYTKNGKSMRIIPDAMFKKDGALQCVEIDRTQKMLKNEEKFKRYVEYSVLYKQKYNKIPIIHFFTITHYRKQKLEQLADKYQVYTIVTLIPEI